MLFRSETTTVSVRCDIEKNGQRVLGLTSSDIAVRNLPKNYTMNFEPENGKYSVENEGDLICSGQMVTPEIIKFMAENAKGLICLAISPEIAEKMELPQMVEQNTESMKTAFTISIDAAEKYGVTTGISAYDRAKTIEVCLAPDAVPSDLRRPGHLFPCMARKGGVLTRTGHTEAVVDMAKLCGHIPAGPMCEIMGKDGHMAKRDELFEFAQKHGIKFISVAD